MLARRNRATSALGMAAAASLALALSACGSDSLDSGGGQSSAPADPTTEVSADSALASKVPADIKAKGTLTIGTDASYAPNEFTGADGKSIEGMDVDLLKAVAAKLGLKVNFQAAGFDSLILGVKSGKYDASISSFTINDERKKEVTMVSYFNAGTQWAVKKGNPEKVSADNACGLSIGVQKGTTQIDDLTNRSKQCTAAGKPAIKQVVEQDQSKVTADLVSGKVVAMAADSPVGLYAVQQTGGQLEPLGSIYDSAPYGVVVPKAQTAFGQALADGFTAIKKDAVYETILKKWGNETGAIDTFEVNP
ncbi:ABC transporter substrate-binding protein [Luteipulveratus flavus]|uniref:ABC transporter substrate-binding protein n=1 Tax=Luteipulveratus flavus TaxID=3031728 RepID=A0ABT6C844_9MICO|nr:ABC transporter substrate-binding protein [Luteipulveratus sp. YIM 133296]MDF8265087.1 ABC transporter substrate-binding protein [Luteipulveratus sp. YIM 133296]